MLAIFFWFKLGVWVMVKWEEWPLQNSYNMTKALHIDFIAGECSWDVLITSENLHWRWFLGRTYDLWNPSASESLNPGVSSESRTGKALGELHAVYRLCLSCVISPCSGLAPWPLQYPLCLHKGSSIYWCISYAFGSSQWILTISPCLYDNLKYIYPYTIIICFAFYWSSLLLW